MWKIFRIASIFMAIGLWADEAIDSPEKLKLERATYHKITIRWEYPNTGVQITNFLIYRDGVEISQTSDYVYMDTSVEPGKYYEYRIAAVSAGGNISALSAPLKVKTFESVDFSQHTQVETVVDSLHEISTTNLTALALFSAVKTGFESLLGGGITLNTFDTDLITQMISEELELIKAASPDWTDAERIAAQAELDQCLQESFGGHSMEQVYMQERLTRLAEDHWQKGNKQAAIILFDFSLNFLKDQENYVSNTLHRLASIKSAHLTEGSSINEIELALEAAAVERFRFFDFFPESTSSNAKYIYSSQASQYFKYFPQLLTYDNYREQAFEKAHFCVLKLKELSEDDAINERRRELIEAWELIRVKVKLHDANSTPRNGTIKITNVTADSKPEYFPSEPFYEERIIPVNGEVEIPVYAGHIYEITASISMPGGKDLVMNLPYFPQDNDRQIVYDTHSAPSQSISTEGAVAEIVVPNSQFPYNLKFVRDIDVFHLSWDWVNSSDFTAAGFKVFNGETLVATVTGNQANNIRLAAPDGNYNYSVVAFNTEGELSLASPVITVEPGDQSAHAEFFAWLQQYFGELPTLSTDDPDGDGVNNYHEFLNGTDPTRAPAPTPAEKQVTYTKITLAWEHPSDQQEGMSWEIRRNGTLIETVLQPKFTDTGLIPGVEYRYTIRCNFADGSTSDWSAPLLLKTQKPETISYGDKLQQIVDMFNPVDLADYTAPSFISAVKSAAESILGTNITFTVVDESLLEKMVASEFEVLQQISGTLTATERLTLRNEISQMMDESFGGNSFEHMYIQSKLSELAEEHWQTYLSDRTKTSHRVAAEMLFDASLSFLSNHRPTVSMTLIRMATMKCQALTEESSKTEVAAALEQQRDILLRYFDFFEDVGSDALEYGFHPYITILHNYFRFFPIVLAYEGYNQNVFDSAMQICNSLANLPNMRPTTILRQKVSAWNLVPLEILCEQVGTSSGTLKIQNVSTRLANAPVPEDFEDTRTISLQTLQQTLPVYGGHWYELEMITPVNGGPDWKQTVGPLFFPAGEKVLYDAFSGISRETLPVGTSGAQLMLKLEQPLAPYNLTAEKLPDALNLSWDWAAPEGFILDHFNVYRGNTLVGTSVTQSLAGIPRVVTEDAAYAYTVTAVGSNGAVTRHSPALLVLPDFTEEEKRYFEWKQQYFGNTPTLATDDPDGDGLNNYQEFILGTNPLVAPPQQESLLNIDKKLGSVVKYFRGSWNKIPDFNSLQWYKQEIRENYCFDTTGEILDSGEEDNVGMTIEGYFDVTQTGTYQFVLSSDEGSRLLIDGREIVKNDHLGSSLEYFAATSLTAGIHSYRIEYFERNTNARLKLYWSGLNFTRIPFEENGHWHIEENNNEFKEYFSWQKDSDGDGLRDADEIKLGTDRFNADSDGDGISDGDEVKKYHTNPLNADSDNDGIPDNEMLELFDPDNLSASPYGLESVVKINPAEFVSATGSWQVLQKRYVTSDDTRGSLTYNVNVPAANIYRLHVTFDQFFPEVREMKLDAYWDGIRIGKISLEMGAGKAELIAYTPWTLAGAHTLTLLWDGYRRETVLQITGIELQKINGPDTDKNGKPDWIDAYLKKHETVRIPDSSFVSPANISGTSKYTALIQVNAITDSFHAAEGEWFADIQLDSEKTTPVEISFQNGGRSISHSINWLETNLLQKNNTTITIRKNDALKLNLHPDNVAEGTWKIRAMGQQWIGNVSTPKVLKFETAGEYSIEGEYFDENQQNMVSANLTVRVIDYIFPDAEPALWINRLRSWDVIAPPEGVSLVPSKSIALFEQSSVLTNGQIRYRIGVNEENDSGVFAKLENGSVLAFAKMKPFYLHSSNETYVMQAEGYDDGTGLYEMPLIASPVLPDTEIRLRIFVAGVLFDNGTTEMKLHAEDFDERGMAKVYFLKHPEATSSVCHTLQVYQNNIYVGIRH